MNILRRYSSILLIIGFISFVFPKTTFAQGDTNETAAKTDSIVEYLTPLEYAFMMHEETKFMLRIPAVGIGAEVEVLPYLTLLGQAQFLIGIYDYNFGISGEARYYYGSKKKGVRNMSGNYFGIGYQRQTHFSSVLSDANTHRVYGKWGMQRRFLGAGLMDIAVNAGYEKFLSNSIRNGSRRTEERIFIQTSGSIGLGVVFNNEKALDKDRLCPALQCFERETFLLKLNTLNLFSFQYADKYKHSIIRINPQAGIEQKIFNSPFSIGANLKFNYNWYQAKYDEIYQGSYSELHSRIQARYYYNLKNRILKGKSGNGFSANYVSGGMYQMYNSTSYSPYGISDYGITLTTGVQRTFSKHLYFDVDLGFAYDLRNDEGLFLYGDVQVGIKF